MREDPLTWISGGAEQRTAAQRVRRGAQLPAVGLVFIGLVVVGCGSESGDPDVEGTVTNASSPAQTSASVAPVTLDEATRSQLDATFNEAFAATGMLGGAAWITIGADEWRAVAGVDDPASGAPFDPDGNVRIASITKTFAATAVLMLVDAGKVALDDPLEKYVEGIANGDTVTVRDLLAMTSGVWDFTSDEAFVARFDADPMLPWTPEQTVDLIRQHGPDFAPGEQVVYCDSNYVLLGLILEQATGLTASEAINTMVVDPLGLDATLFPAPDQPGVPEPATSGYLPPPEGTEAPPTLVGDINPQWAWTAGNMTSNMTDLHRWAAELADGSLLDPATQAERLDSQRFTGQQVNLAYGLGVLTLNDLIGHNGAIIGYSTAVFRYPQADATFVIVGNESTNETTPTLDIFFSLLRQLYPDQIS